MSKSSLPAKRRANYERGKASRNPTDTDGAPGYGQGVSNNKADVLGKDQNFGNVTPQELRRDPYRVNKNAKDCK